MSSKDSSEDRQNEPDYFQDVTSSQQVLETWRKGQKHLDTFWKLLFNHDVLSLRERTQKDLKARRVQSEIDLTKGDVVLLKQDRRKMFQVRGAEPRRREDRPGVPGACFPGKVLISDSETRFPAFWGQF